jgi:hypothetical protein
MSLNDRVKKLEGVLPKAPRPEPAAPLTAAQQKKALRAALAALKAGKEIGVCGIPVIRFANDLDPEVLKLSNQVLIELLKRDGEDYSWAEDVPPLFPPSPDKPTAA